MCSSQNDNIYKANSILIDIDCKYESSYSQIQANDISITSENVETEANGDGLFKFDLTQFNDKNMTEITELTDTSRIGDDLYFKLTMQNPVSNLVFSIIGKKFQIDFFWLSVIKNSQTFSGCEVMDSSSNNTYPIISDRCSDVALGMEEPNAFYHNGTQTGVGFSYPAFGFTQRLNTTSSEQTLECSVILSSKN